MKTQARINYTISNKGNKHAAIELPIEWLDELELDAEFPFVTLEFDGDSIVIEKDEEANDRYYYIVVNGEFKGKHLPDGICDDSFYHNTSKTAVKKEFDKINEKYIKDWLESDFDSAVVEMWLHPSEDIDSELIYQKHFYSK